MATPTWSWAATRYAVGDGNWSATTTWSDVSCEDAGPGTVPGNGDDVDLCDNAVVWDASSIAIPSSGSLGAVTASGGGSLTVDMDAVCDNENTPNKCSLTATTITGGANTATGTIVLNGASDTSNIVAITASGSNGITGGSTSQDYAVKLNGVGILNVDANVNSGSGGSSCGIVAANGYLNISGTSKTIKAVGGVAVTYEQFSDGGSIVANVESATSKQWAGVSADKSGITLTGNLINIGGMAWIGYAPVWNPKAATPDSYISMTADGATSLFYSDIPAASNVLTTDTVAGETGTAEAGSGGGGAYAY